MLNDIVVFKRIKEGDIKAFEKVFRHYYSLLCVYAFGITGRKDIAEEVVQDVFYTIWKDREGIRIVRSVKNYLYGAVRNESLQYLAHLTVEERHRSYVINRECPETSLSPQERLEYEELENVIDQALNGLPERRLQIFRMHRIEGKKYREIADFFSISVKTVEAEMSKVYRTLRLEIEKYV